MSQRKERILSASQRSSEGHVNQGIGVRLPEIQSELQQGSKQTLKDTASVEKERKVTTIQFVTDKGCAMSGI